MTDEVAVIRIIGGAGSEGVSTNTRSGAIGGAGSPSRSGGGMAVAMGGALKAVGIASLVGLVASLVTANKSLMSVVGGIMRMLGYLLKPITDVVTALLMPVLFALKPIVLIVNRVMQPFIRLAMESFRTGAQLRAEGDLVGAGKAELAGMGAALAGVSAAIGAFFAETIKMQIANLTMMLGGLLQPVFSFFGVTEQEMATRINSIIGSVNTGIDALTVSMIGLNADAAAALADRAGIDTAKFRMDVSKMIGETFNAPDGLTSRIQAMLSTTEVEGFGYVAGNEIRNAIGGSDGITSVFSSEFESFKEKGVEKVQSAVKAMNDAWDGLQKMESRSSRGWFGVVADGLGEIGSLGFARTETFR